MKASGIALFLFAACLTFALTGCERENATCDPTKVDKEIILNYAKSYAVEEYGIDAALLNYLRVNDLTRSELHDHPTYGFVLNDIERGDEARILGWGNGCGILELFVVRLPPERNENQK